MINAFIQCLKCPKRCSENQSLNLINNKRRVCLLKNRGFIMQPFVIYYNGKELDVICSEQLGPVFRFCATTNETYILSDGRIYYGSLPRKIDEKLILNLMFDNVADIDIWNDHFYMVDKSGVVRRRKADKTWTEISFDPLEIAEQKIRISKVKCNSLGAVFITENNEVYAMGSCGDIFNCQLPIRLKCFDKPVMDVSAGEDFFILLVSNEYNDADGQHFGRNSQSSSCNRPTNSSKVDRSSENSINSHESNGAMYLEENILNIIRDGFALVSTTVCSFGITNNGVLGTGDHIKRSGINQILRLCDIGICSISTGNKHSVARTIDGRLFHWGLNSRQQHPNSNIELSSPTEINLNSIPVDKTEAKVLEACYGDYSTIVLKFNGQGIEKQNEDILQRQLYAMNVPNEPQDIALIFTAGDLTLYNYCKFRHQYYQYLFSLQQCLQQSKKTLVRLILGKQEKVYLKQICQYYLQVVYTLFTCCKSLENFYRSETKSFNELVWIRSAKEVIKIFEEYTKLYCDVLSVNGFSNMCNMVHDIESLSVEEMIRIFHLPFGQISNFVKLVETLARNITEEPSSNELNEKLLLWQAFSRKNQIDIELAEHTNEFWLRNEKNQRIRLFMKKHRRVILAPTTTIPVKWFSGVTMSSNIFILFSDCLCQYGGSTLQTYPLVVVWVKKESDLKLKITTPEKTFSLEAKNYEDKKVWYDQLEYGIMTALGHPGGRLSNVRTTAYVFGAKHPRYAKVHAYGRWKNGIMHGKCYLEFPDGKTYFGDVKNGEIQGHGKMVIPSFGMYVGNFKAGKFNGYGCLEMKENEVYDGNFREDMYHGHGILRTNTYTYVGEYQANVRCGYGILDDMITGDKYMGMFADNKRVGAGTCITMNGDYFEGIFVNDELTGAGIAVFENGYYYEGELTIRGPAGKGTYYLPHEVIDDETDDDATKPEMIGNIISGHLSGTWNDVRIISGTVAINRKFPKFPKSIGELVVDNSRKWRTLFDNFEEHIIGQIDFFITATPKQLWNRIAVFMTNHRNQEKFKDSGSFPAFAHSYFSKNISMDQTLSLDKVSLKSINSLSTPSVKVNMSDVSANLHTKTSCSQETLFEGCDGLQGEIFYDENILSSNITNTHLDPWATDSLTSTSTQSSIDSSANLSANISNGLEFVPNFGINSLTEDDLASIKDYLEQAFKDSHHPLCLLNQNVSNCFYISYGCWKVKPTPILAKQAMSEWESISKRVYQFVRKLFPALPEDFCIVEGSREVVSHISLLYPIVLSEGIYSTLFVLYANKYSRKDERYRQSLIFSECKTDRELAKCLALDESYLGVLSNELFYDAIAMLKQLQEKYSPKAMLTVIENVMQLITAAHKSTALENGVILAADTMMPLVLFLVLRAGVPHLGAELALLDDLIGGSYFQSEMSGLAGYCYTTIKAAYEHITSNPFGKP